MLCSSCGRPVAERSQPRVFSTHCLCNESPEDVEAAQEAANLGAAKITITNNMVAANVNDQENITSQSVSKGFHETEAGTTYQATGGNTAIKPSVRKRDVESFQGTRDIPSDLKIHSM